MANHKNGDRGWLEREETYEAYVAGKLSPEDRDAFEEHFFESEDSFQKLQAYKAMHEELSLSGLSVTPGRASESRIWGWALAACAAGLLVVAGVTLWLRNPAPIQRETATAVPPGFEAPPLTPPEVNPARTALPPKEQPAPPAAISLAVLAEVEAPIYLPGALRGPVDESMDRFQAAMWRYREKDYEGAIPGLDAAAGLNPKAPHISFFLAICNLLTDRLDPAVAVFEKTIALGESPYLEEAHFYLAKARMRQGNVPEARAGLERTVARHGRLAPEARRLLKEPALLPAAKDRPPEK